MRFSVARMGTSVLLVAGLLVAAPQAVAATVDAPTARSSAVAAPTLEKKARNLGTVLLSGRTAKRKDRMVLQRRTAKKRWVRAERFTSRRHRFRIVVWKKRRRTPYRVVDRSSRRRSEVRRVPRLRVTRDACGVRPLKASGEPWRCSFHDDFEGTTLDLSRWTIQKDGFITGDPPGAAACYSGKNVSVADGSLRLVARRASLLECPGLAGITKIFTSGMVSTHDTWSQRYGRFEARIHNTATTRRGLHEAYWLWPDERYGAVNGDEIDISETYSVYPTLSVPYLHYGADDGAVLSGPEQNTAYDCMAHRGEWNTYRMQWSASRIRIWVNGDLCLSNTSGSPAFRKRYIMMFTQALGSGTNAYNLLLPPPIPATMKVDYARVWR
ncbi:glycoside hydrolase family 16 protein [Nocardioides sp. JQ2195]|uniref:glycoside hydrolase family 16 protein n=1 Tax=Nocardioides sp. JQ2195 TaxID=2592334 RepID=UPI00143E107D|nr:glycoside hydrolase family 16 protein [Nocardioides sp. JQ2195]QIX26136.1 glycoside hydrolase family 16 protein [Nocardioides sp. JQ2195]